MVNACCGQCMLATAHLLPLTLRGCESGRKREREREGKRESAREREKERERERGGEGERERERGKGREGGSFAAMDLARFGALNPKPYTSNPKP